MSKEYGGYYSIQLTNYGYCENDTRDIFNILRYIFWNLISDNSYKDMLATIYLKDGQNDFEVTYDLHYLPRKRLSLLKNEQNKTKCIDFSYCRKYLSIKPSVSLKKNCVITTSLSLSLSLPDVCLTLHSLLFLFVCYYISSFLFVV